MDDRFERGMQVRREVLGDDHVDRAGDRTTEFTRPFQDYITEAVWGSIWTRPGLDRRTRSCITLAVLTALGRHEEIAMHVRAAVRNGLTADEIAEVLLHTGAYAGVPAANAAFSIGQQVLTTIDPSTE
ncbi:4-carboxymuconolactone decarboxylase [Nocardia violaceofusca]|uniref:4-carboxymuconolactone decarboxylase n=1 Tax=Nocardia violaceofusca TaxID=941182 RepID=UPI0007A54152|nr:4-carboxymuconolactone decarboxylase [Nocardia violaceofusca]